MDPREYVVPGPRQPLQRLPRPNGERNLAPVPRLRPLLPRRDDLQAIPADPAPPQVQALHAARPRIRVELPDPGVHRVGLRPGAAVDLIATSSVEPGELVDLIEPVWLRVQDARSGDIRDRVVRDDALRDGAVQDRAQDPQLFGHGVRLGLAPALLLELLDLALGD